jgi:hypothetical protein
VWPPQLPRNQRRAGFGNQRSRGSEGRGVDRATRRGMGRPIPIKRDRFKAGLRPRPWSPKGVAGAYGVWWFSPLRAEIFDTENSQAMVSPFRVRSAWPGSTMAVVRCPRSGLHAGRAGRCVANLAAHHVGRAEPPDPTAPMQARPRAPCSSTWRLCVSPKLSR